MDEVEALLGTNRWIMKKWGLVFVIVRGLGIYILERERVRGGMTYEILVETLGK